MSLVQVPLLCHARVIIGTPGDDDILIMETEIIEAVETGGGNDSIINGGEILGDFSVLSADILGITLTLMDDNYLSVDRIRTILSTGIDGGSGDDYIWNYGDPGDDDIGNYSVIEIKSISDLIAGDVSIEFEGTGSANTDVISKTVATGINGGDGSDTIENTGIIDVFSDSHISTGTVFLSLSGPANASSAVVSDSVAIGIAGGSDEDIITNIGSVLVASEAETVAGGVSVTFSGGSSVTAPVKANSTAIALAGGFGDDTITSNNLKSTASATVGNGSVVVDIQREAIAPVFDMAVTDTPATATSNAFGIDGGEGLDSVTTTGTTIVKATSKVVGADVALNVTDAIVGVGFSGSVAESNLHATSNAAGVINAEGTINNTGEINVASASEIQSSSVGVNVQGTLVGAVAGTTFTNISSLSEADTVGVSSSITDDIITNTGSITTNANAKTSATSVAVTAAGLNLGVQGQLTLANAANTVKAVSTGINSGAGNDTINNSGIIDSNAHSWLENTNVSVNASLGPTSIGGAHIDVNGTAISSGVGIESGEGDDNILNTASVSAVAQSYNLGASRSFILANLGGAIAKGILSSESSAIAISTGGGDDSLVNKAELLADAKAHGQGISSILNVTGYVDADGSSLSKSSAIGVDLGVGNDYFLNESSITAKSFSYAESEVEGVNLVGATFAGTNNLAHSNTIAIKAGEGADSVMNKGDLRAEAHSNTSVGSFSSTFLAGYSEASSGPTSETVSIGIDGGAGNDLIDNSGSITVKSLSEVLADSSTISLFTVGNAANVLTADSNAFGIAGGDGNDNINNNGTINVTAESTNYFSIANPSLGGIVSFNTNFAGVSIIDTSLVIMTDATGIDSGSGDDVVLNTGSITVNGKSTARTGNSDVKLGGATFSTSDTTAKVEAKGIVGNDGNDRIHNDGAILVTADVLLPEDAVNKNYNGLVGYSKIMASAIGETNALGIDGGAGDDIIQNNDTITVRGKTNGFSSNINVLEGIEITHLESDLTLTSHSTGIAGGSGNDGITSQGALDIRSDTIGTALNQGNWRLFGYMEGSTATNITSKATGIDGEDGDDYILTDSMVTVTSYSNGSAMNFTADLSGAKICDASTTVNSIATGVYGGDGDDSITNNSLFTIRAESISENTDSRQPVTVNLAGYADTDVSNTLLADATGLSGGAGKDSIQNNNTLTVEGVVTSEAPNTTVDLFGGAVGNVTINAEALATGIKGGQNDDVIANNGALAVTADVIGDATATSVVLTGYSEADATSNGSSNAMGINGGEGDDIITNTSTISLISNAKSIAGSTSYNSTGGAGATAGTKATAMATGIQGGTGSDGIENNSSINATAKGVVDASASTIALRGYAPSYILNTAVSTAKGISADNNELATPVGNDTIINTAKITLLSEAEGTAGGVSVSLEGYAPVTVATTTEALSIGIESGFGDDILTNKAAISSSSKSSINSGAVAVNIAGYGATTATLSGNAQAIGIKSGNGSDTINNESSINVLAESSTDASNVTVGITGISSAAAMITSIADAVGIRGGEDDNEIDGDDRITNSGNISVISNASGVAGNVTVNISGASIAGATTSARANAVGIDSSSGADVILNEALITVNAESELDVTSKTVQIAGATSGDTNTYAKATATAISGGADDDVIVNRAAITVGSLDDPMASAHASDTIWTGLGVGSTGSILEAVVQSNGIGGGTGNDTIYNEGDLHVMATSQTEVAATSWSFAGAAATDAVSTSKAEAHGITGEDGNDFVANTAQINVKSLAKMFSNAISFVFAGGVSGSDTLTASSDAIGIATGDGNDVVLNDGEIVVEATSDLAIDGIASSIIGGAEITASSTVDSTSTGVNLGEGDDFLLNNTTGNINVMVNTDVMVDSIARAGMILSDGKSKAEITSTATVSGIVLGEGVNEVVNKGRLNVHLAGTTKAIGSINPADILSIFGIDVDAFATAIASLEKGIAIGITGGDGVNTIESTGHITVTASPTVIANAHADGGGLVSGDGTARATADADGVEAIGIDVGDGDNLITSGTMTVEASPIARADAVSDADGLGLFTQPDSRATSTVSANGILAIGIQTGNGNNTIINEGMFSVTTAPDSYVPGYYLAGAFAHPGDDFVGIDSFATATSTANNAQAYGIRTGDGDNLIWNKKDGNINVVSNPNAFAEAQAEGVGLESDAIAIATATADNALAIAIQTGSGNDTIINEGTIIATATPNASAIAVSVGHHPSNIAIESTANAVAIAITSGDGDDVLILGDESVVYGDIDLGNDNDTLHLIGTPSVTGALLSGTGENALVFEGAGSFRNSLDGFISASKIGEGTYTVSTLGSGVRDYEITEGTLEISHDYNMATDGSFSVQIDGDGGHGQLKVDGTVGLAGELIVTQGIGIFKDGALYNVILADNAAGTFSNEVLPEDTALVSFQATIHSDHVEVKALVKNSTTVANNILEKIIANYLDGLIPVVSGDLSQDLAKFQNLSESEFGPAFVSLSPDTYTNSTRSAIKGTHQYSRTIQQRMHSLRSGLEATIAEAEPDYGLWLQGFKQNSDLDGRDGFTGYDADQSGLILGSDVFIGNNMLIGGSLGYSRTDIDFEYQRGKSNIESLLGSLYGSWFTEQFYFDAALSFGLQDFENTRNITIGSIERTATSDHDGNIFSGYMESGYNFNFDRWLLGPFISINYLSLKEDSFIESGAGSLDLIVDERRTNALISDLGLAIAGLVHYNDLELMTALRVAWRHDFDIDDYTLTSAYTGEPDAKLSIAGMGEEQDGLIVEVGATLFHIDGVSVSLNLNVDFREDYLSHGAEAIIRYEF